MPRTINPRAILRDCSPEVVGLGSPFFAGEAAAFVNQEHQIMCPNDLGRALTHISHEVLERHKSTEGLVVASLQTRGVPLARRIADRIVPFEGADVPIGTLDISLYRDYTAYRSRPSVKPSYSYMPIDNARIVLADDLLHTGGSIRAALDPLTDFGRSLQVQLAVLADRGHRQLSIRDDYVGHNIPTSPYETLRVRLQETDGTAEVALPSAKGRG